MPDVSRNAAGRAAVKIVIFILAYCLATTTFELYTLLSSSGLTEIYRIVPLFSASVVLALVLRVFWTL